MINRLLVASRAAGGAASKKPSPAGNLTVQWNQIRLYSSDRPANITYPDLPISGTLDQIRAFANAHSLPILKFSYVDLKDAILLFSGVVRLGPIPLFSGLFYLPPGWDGKFWVQVMLQNSLYGPPDPRTGTIPGAMGPLALVAPNPGGSLANGWMDYMNLFVLPVPYLTPTSNPPANPHIWLYTGGMVPCAGGFQWLIDAAGVL